MVNILLENLEYLHMEMEMNLTIGFIILHDHLWWGNPFLFSICIFLFIWQKKSHKHLCKRLYNGKPTVFSLALHFSHFSFITHTNTIRFVKIFSIFKKMLRKSHLILKLEDFYTMLKNDSIIHSPIVLQL